MATKTAYVLLLNGYADWEPASALAELRRTFGFHVRNHRSTVDPIISMGGIEGPSGYRYIGLCPESAAILILPGGDDWIEGTKSRRSPGG